MKLFLVFGLFLTLADGEFSPTKVLKNSLKNNHFLVGLTTPVDYRWNLIPNDDGRLHLVDINPVQAEISPLFNSDVDTTFLLFTRSNPTVAQRVTWTAASISNSNFNSAHPVRVLIHGFNSGPSSGINLAVTASYLQRGNFNVIV